MRAAHVARTAIRVGPPAPLTVQPSHGGPITLRVMGMAGSWSDGPQDLGAPSSRAGRPGAARPSQPVDAGRPLPAPFSPTPPLSPGPPGGPPLRSGFERRSPAWRPPAATAPAFRTQEQGAARWGRQGLCCPHCVRDDYGGQRERSGIARAAVPRRAGPEGSSRVLRSPSGSHAVICVRPLWWTASCPRRGRRRGSTSSIDARRGLTGILLRSGGSSASLARPTQHRCRPTLRRPPASQRAASSRSGRP